MKELIRSNTLLRHVIDVYLKAGSADAGPPLGTILGNLGINTAKFCKDFNDFTKVLPTYFFVKLRIFVFENRTFTFEVAPPSSTYLINILKYQKSIQVRYFDRLHSKDIFCVKLFDIFLLCRFKIKELNFYSAFKTIWSTVNSCGLSVSII